MEMNIIEKSQELDKILLLYIKGEVTKEYLENARQQLNKMLEKE